MHGARHLSISETASDALGPLNDIEEEHAPSKLYLLGDRALLHQAPRIAIVGSRRASLGGRRRALRLARRLVDRGGVVVSELALMRAVVENEALVWPKEMIGLGAQVLVDPEEFLSEFPPVRFAPVTDAPF